MSWVGIWPDLSSELGCKEHTSARARKRHCFKVPVSLTHVQIYMYIVACLSSMQGCSACSLAPTSAKSNKCAAAQQADALLQRNRLAVNFQALAISLLGLAGGRCAALAPSVCLPQVALPVLCSHVQTNVQREEEGGAV